MSQTDELLKNNEAYAEKFDKGGLPLPPARKVAVVACMDARLNPSYLLGLEEGDAHVIRNAGGVITDDEIRSLAISQRLLGTEEIILIHHTDCGMLTFQDDDFKPPDPGGHRDQAAVGGRVVRRPRGGRPAVQGAHRVEPVRAQQGLDPRLHLRRRHRAPAGGLLARRAGRRKLRAMSDDHGDPISYQALQPGTPIVSSDDRELGTVERVIENTKEHIFDGIVMRTGERLPVGRRAGGRAHRRAPRDADDRRRGGAQELTDYAPGAPEYRANVRGGRLSRFFGGGWKRH